MNTTIGIPRKERLNPYDDDDVFNGFLVWEVELLNIDKGGHLNNYGKTRKNWLVYYKFIVRASEDERQTAYRKCVHLLGPNFSFKEITG